MKNTVTVIFLVFAALFVYTKLVGPIPFSVTSTTTTKTDSFSVTGEGKVLIKPDIAIVSVGVVSQGNTVKVTQTKLNEAVNAVSQAVKGVGVGDKDIQTTNYSIYPQYDYDQPNPRITGYQASSNLTIKVRDIDKTNDVIDQATAAGANTVGGISFDIDDREKATNEARQKAVDDAKKKASDAAQIAGFGLGRIVNYQEGLGGSQPPNMPYSARGGEMAMDKAAPTQIEPGSSEVIVNVTLSYEIH